MALPGVKGLRVNLPLLRNEPFLLQVIGPNGLSLDERAELPQSSSLQVDLNQEQAGKTIQKAQQYYSMTKRVPREQKDPYIFDEAQSAIQKEILPYWAGFCKQFRDSNMTPEFPSKWASYTFYAIFNQKLAL